MMERKVELRVSQRDHESYYLALSPAALNRLRHLLLFNIYSDVFFDSSLFTELTLEDALLLQDIIQLVLSENTDGITEQQDVYFSEYVASKCAKIRADREAAARQTRGAC